MTTFENRERAEEARFVQAEDAAFRARAKRNRLIALWAAERLGKSGEEARLYAGDVLTADFKEPGDQDVIVKLQQDFEAAGAPLTEQDIRAKWDELIAAAEPNSADSR
jgi:hypothetical protein